MEEIRRTFIPQFSVRLILVLTAAAAVISFVIARAGQGEAWAGGIALGLIALVFTFFVYAALYAAVSLFGRFTATRQIRRRTKAAEKTGLRCLR